MVYEIVSRTTLYAPENFTHARNSFRQTSPRIKTPVGLFDRRNRIVSILYTKDYRLQIDYRRIESRNHEPPLTRHLNSCCVVEIKRFRIKLSSTLSSRRASIEIVVNACTQRDDNLCAHIYAHRVLERNRDSTTYDGD